MLKKKQNSRVEDADHYVEGPMVTEEDE